MEHSTLKSALAVANDYDRIEVYPGIYDEQFEMSSKIPFELIGVGELGSIILVVCIEQIGLTGRVSNLVFRAPWFTNFILKASYYDN
jgi:F-box protein 10